MRIGVPRLFLIIALLLPLVGAQPARAATFKVTNTNDSGAGSLREAIASASAGDTITFKSSLSGQTITLASMLTIDEDLTIDGSALAAPITVSGDDSVRVMRVDSGVSLTVDSLVIADGLCSTCQGGGIIVASGASLQVNNSTFVGNSARFGGGIYNAGGTIVVSNSSFSTNTSVFNGGGLHNKGTATIFASTFSGNDSDEGGGIYNGTGDSLVVTNSTFSGNTAADGGGLLNRGTSTVTNSTFSGNGATLGGGISNRIGGTLNLRNTILANSNSALGGRDCENDGSIGANTNNLMESRDGCGTPAFTSDPQLGSLADNGGPTQTFALPASSPAKDAGTNTALDEDNTGVDYNGDGDTDDVLGYDQRGSGFDRISFSTVDIGAFEYYIEPLTVTSSTPEDGGTLASGSTELSVTFSEDAVHDGGAEAANNTDNYLLVEWGANASFNTGSCAAGTGADDSEITIAGASYDDSTFTATLTLASPIARGHYRLLVCGTTSVWSLSGAELNNGANDTRIDFLASGATPSSLIVTTAADTAADDGECSLREAIENANTDSQNGRISAGECAPGSGTETITFASSLSGATITLASTLPAVNDHLVIDSSALATQITISGDDSVRVMYINSGVAVELKELTIAEGNCGGGSCWGSGIYNNGDLAIVSSTFSTNVNAWVGGGIFSSGKLEVTSSTFQGNASLNEGGAIFNNGALEVETSTFKGNMSDLSGGAITSYEAAKISESLFSDNSAMGGGALSTQVDGAFTIVHSSFEGNRATAYDGGAFYTGAIYVSGSTFSGNTAARDGGAIFLTAASTISNSSFSGNTAGRYGGGIFNNLGALTLTNSTLSGNSAGSLGGAMYMYGDLSAVPGGGTIQEGKLDYANTILANSSSGGDCYNDGGEISTNSNNLVEANAAGPNDCGTPSLTSDPRLGALADNGGPTRTMALLDGSPAIDAGDKANCTANDQRGEPRPVDGDGDGAPACDIGAYERQLAGPGGQQASAAIADSSITTLQLGRLIVDVPASAIPPGETNCRVLISVDGESDAYGFELGDTVWDVKIICDSGKINILFDAVTVCVRPKDGVTEDKTLFHRHDGGSFTPLAESGTRSGYVCGETRTLSLFTLGAYSLPDTGFAPGSFADLGEPRFYASTGLILDIPTLDLQTSIAGVPQGPNGWDVSWLGDSAGYLGGTAFPTLPGNTVITAHVWGADNQPGPFYGMEILQHGDRFSIEAWGATYTYEVRLNALYSPDNLHPLAHEEYDWVTLVTCQGFDEASGEYVFRRVVRAVLVEISNK